MRVKTLAMTGVDLYCPDCRRQLVWINPDGTIDIASHAALEGTALGERDEFGVPQPPNECVITAARCLRRRCRLRQWIKRRGGKHE